MKEKGAADRYLKYTQCINPGYFHRPLGLHGINHTKRVLFFVELLTALGNLAESERDILSLAAVYHDIGRTNDGVDPGHGYASFMKSNEMDLIKTDIPEDYNTVKYLIETHCINDREAFGLVKNYALQEPDRAERLLKFFKDADGLDRVRINDLNPGMLRLPISKELVQMAWELLLIPDVNALFSAT
jgi:HD superfamily phosphodiesterase